jgi:ketosteroid isomerase-like protein
VLRSLDIEVRMREHCHKVESSHCARGVDRASQTQGKRGAVKRIALLSVSLVLLLAACGGSDTNSAASQDLQRQADINAIDQIEKTWHRASSTHDVDLMMTIWAPDATFNVGTPTLVGKAQIRSFFAKAGPFQPEHHWLSETPAYKIRITANGDKGTLYFECHYVDIATGKVVSIVAADQNVQKIDGRWLITSSAAAPATLGT